MQGLILYGHQLVKDNSVYNNQQKLDVFLNSSSIMKLGVYKKRLQELYCRFEIRRTLRAAKDERHVLRFFKDCSSLSVPQTPS